MPPPERPSRPEPDLDGTTTVIDGEREALPPASPSQDAPRSGEFSTPQSKSSFVPRPGGAQPFRPTARAPIPILTVFDDGRTDGETIRIRTSRFVIGRVEGDLTIPIDGRISSRHVEIGLQTIDGSARWVLTDLQSRHGLFVRVTRTALYGRTEFLIGGGRYLFEGPVGPDETVAEHDAVLEPDGRDPQTEHTPSPSVTATLTELLPNHEGTRTSLVDDEYWIGTDASCAIRRVGDPFCEPRHARLWRSAGGLWNVEHDHTFNGLWIRTRRFVLEAPVRFQIGEQRFQINV